MGMKNTSESWEISKNFDLSVVMPYYKKISDFRITLEKNASYLQRNGIEVILCLDSPDDEEALIRLIKNYPLINWKVFINRVPHAWRNPSRAINVGIRNASNKYILVMGPDSQMYTDIIAEFSYMAHHYPGSFFTGEVCFLHHGQAFAADAPAFPLLPYGSLFVARESLQEVRGYNENYNEWGGDDDNIRARLSLSGLNHLHVPEAILLHRESGMISGHQSRGLKSRSIPVERKKDIYYPDSSVANNHNWGTDFTECIYDYRENIYAAELLSEYLENNCIQYEHGSANMLAEKYQIIILMPVYNEKRHMPAVLKHLEEYCDGIIVLDDESNDGTYDLLKSEKLVLKAKKRRDQVFDDLKNRNMLLDMASFFSVKWLVFMDADERFDKRWGLKIPQQDLETEEAICFYLVHLWDDENFYRSDIPEVSPIGVSGVLHRWRMFRNKGRMQILTNKTLHFPSVPYTSKKSIQPVLILHYGMLDKEWRSIKHSKYIYEDTEIEKYDYFLSEKCSLSKIDDLTELKRYKQI